ncbi:hypothetical protein [Halobellus inordinatus]|uniref:hypothetical protein n=1 Tax=Halobellus inordinatus TaxID=1126236 RepID=UPI00210BFB2B|nr:hypothetical protein [Halobellus inordinatus]
MPIDVIGWVSSHVGLVLTVVLAIALLTWAYEAAEEADDAMEAARGFGSNAKRGTGGVLNVLLAGLVTVTGWAATTFSTAGEAGQFLLSLVPFVPVLTASALTISLGAIGLADVIVIEWWHFVLVSTAIVLLGYAYRADLSMEASGR